jgi:predicted transposase/invertase (TIGR01784 family)
MTTINNPHDAFVRHSFENPLVLQEFCSNYLPRSVAEQIEINKVRLDHDSFVDKNLKEHLSDLLINAPLRNSSTAKIYILFEHKSGDERFVMLQLLRYMVQIWQKELAAQKSVSSYCLTPIIPLILYHGDKQMTAPVEFSELIKAVPEMERYTPRFSAHLLDLSVIDENDLSGGVRIFSVMNMLQIIRSSRLNDRLPEIVKALDTISEQQDVLSIIRTILFYALSGSDKVTEAAVTRTVQQIRNGGEIMNTLVKKWVDQGFRKGVEEGIEKGIEKGIRKGREEGFEKGIEKGIDEVRIVILKAVKARFGEVSEKMKSYVASTSDTHVLEGIIPLVISCSSAEEMESSLGIK